MEERDRNYLYKTCGEVYRTYLKSAHFACYYIKKSGKSEQKYAPPPTHPPTTISGTGRRGSK